MSVQEVINLVSQFAEYENIRVAARESLKAGVITGICTLAGGLLAGRAGVATGGVMGVLASTYFASDFKSVTYVIRYEMTNAQRRTLANSVINVLSSLSGDYTLYSIISNKQVRDGILSAIKTAMQNMGYMIAN